MRPIESIIVHVAATPPGMDIGAPEIRDWHVNDNGWRDIGYHYVIRRNGTTEEGRPLEEPGAHAAGHNQRSIGVCLIGGVDEDGNADCNITRAQWAALDALVDYLVDRFPDAVVRGHRQYDDGKACPTFDVPAWFNNT